MDLRKLRYFVAVAKAGSISAAAHRLHMAQPALTQSISRLEKEMRLRLFLRSKRGVELTEAGSFLLDEARDLLARAEAIERSAERHAEGSIGSITVGFVSTALYRALPSAIARLKRAQPQARIVVREMRTNEQIEALRVGEIDMGICHTPIRPASWLQHLVFAEYHLHAALPDAEAGRAPHPVSMAQVAERGLILFPENEGPPDRTDILKAFAMAGCQPRIVQEASPALAVLACVSAGLGAALLPECASFIGVGGTNLHEIEQPHSLPTIGLALIRRTQPRRRLVDQFWGACVGGDATPENQSP